MLNKIVDVFWPAKGLQREDGYKVFASLVSQGVFQHGEPLLQLRPVAGGLRCRCTPRKAAQLLSRSRLAVRIEGWDGSRSIAFGKPEVLALEPAETLRAWIVTIKNADNAERLKAAVEARLSKEGVSAAVAVGERRVLRIRDLTIFGYEVILDSLSEEESLAVQAAGIGGRTHFGCGVFLPC